ncbi:hypothetical protein [Deinococcus sp. NW-56]|uniref:hypothetical protein n=1 Tax=Deinococcus sp. NW-56 TaxID=2080419 RepID=UPI000CF53A2E|nr:hypothetical protein [Deinococcus sp. NW-56]
MEVRVRYVHGFCTNHRKAVLASERCGCFYCERFFNPSEITEWIDEEQTALCPLCDIDAVLPESKTYTLDSHLLAAMHEAWF